MKATAANKDRTLGSQIILGTASFGQVYGVVNEGNFVEAAKIRDLVDFCRKQEVFGIDTAPAYGEAERMVGEVGAGGFAIITKVTCLDALTQKTLRRRVEASLKNLKVKKCYGLMLHDDEKLQGHQGGKVSRNLAELKKMGLVERIGVSSYDPLTADRFLNEFGWDLVQIPYSVLDRRALEGGFLEKWHCMGISVCLRSIFLQGLLLRDPSRSLASTGSLPMAECAAFRQQCHNIGLSPLEACLLFVLQSAGRAKVVVGPTCKREMEEILNLRLSREIPELPLPKWKPSFDPRNWN